MDRIERYALEIAIKRGLIGNEETKLKGHLFKQQRQFADDKERFKVAQCTRRAGKSELAADILYEAATKTPNSVALYIALTRRSAKNIIWPKLLALKDKYNIECTPLEGALEVKFPNNSIIWCVGADMTNFIERLRGGAYSTCVVDEAQSFRSHLGELIDDVLTPALIDFNGTLNMFGTPGPIPQGYFYEATEKNIHGYSLHKWGMLDNPFIPQAQSFMDEMIEKRNWTKENPTFRREYLNEWVLDLDALFYKFREEKNVLRNSPLNKHNRVLGIDYGFNDKTTFAILAYSNYSPDIFIEYTEGHSEMIPSQIAGRVQQLVKKYNPSKIVADTGGLGKSITEEMIRRYSIPVHAAEKTDKYSFVSLMNGDFIDGNLHVFESNTDLIHQYKTLIKDDKDPSKEDQTMPNDYCDAALYAYRYIRAYHFEKKQEPQTAKQYYEEIEDKIWKTEKENLKKKTQMEWWEQ